MSLTRLGGPTRIGKAWIDLSDLDIKLIHQTLIEAANSQQLDKLRRLFEQAREVKVR